MKKIAVVLSGCGFKDGAEVTESVSTLVCLSEAGAHYDVFAPDIEFSAVDHINDQAQAERNALTESSRISRGKITDLKDLDPGNYDGIAFPGGFGVAKHLCTWATEGASCNVNPETQQIIEAFHKDSKPILAICIAPALVAKVLGKHNPSLTIGNDKDTATEIEKTGASHEPCEVDDFITDRLNKIVTTPAYMYGDARPHLVFKGIQGAIREFYEMA